MEQMSTSTGQLNDIICGSPMFAPQCPPELRGALAPGMSAGSQIISDEAEADSQDKTLPEVEEENAGSPSVTDDSEANSPVPDAEEENAGSPSVTDESEADSPVPDAEEENGGSPSVTDESEADSQNNTLSDAGDEISGNP